MPTIEWVTPAPLWGVTNGGGSGLANGPQAGGILSGVEFRRPRLVKLAGDNFLPAFLESMEGRAADPAGFLTGEERNFTASEDRDGNVLKLYHPAHGRYYLAVGSLVCRQLGLPDRGVARQDGEATFFVIRRRVAGNGGATVEQGWVDEGPNRGWQPLVDERGQPVAVRADEERLPLHPVNAILSPARGSAAFRALAAANGGAASPLATLTGARRTLYYGYIPVGNREKYAARRPLPEGTPAEILDDYQAEVRALSTVDAGFDYRLDEITTRVVALWGRLFDPNLGLPDRLLDGPGDERAPTVSLYMILDLADWLSRYVPEVFLAITQNASLPAGSARDLLRDDLADIDIQVQTGGTGSFTTISLADAIEDLAPYLPLVQGVGDEPADVYEIRNPVFPNAEAPASYLSTVPEGRFHERLREALEETTLPSQVPQEVVDLLANQVTLEPPDAALIEEGTYYLRFVYEHAPCEPKVSQLSPAFTFARYFDPDAPARPIRIQLPSIAPKDLRKYKRGVGMEMAPELRDVMNRIHKGMLDGDGLQGPSGGWELGWICSFSLQIIFLVAFIVMFIFLIALNFIFWWLPFLKICLPIPVKKGNA